MKPGTITTQRKGRSNWIKKPKGGKVELKGSRKGKQTIMF